MVNGGDLGWIGDQILEEIEIEIEGGHFGQVRTLRGVILDKIGD